MTSVAIGLYATPNDPSDSAANPQAEDVVLTPTLPLPPRDQPGTSQLLYTRGVKMGPLPDEFEMYNVTADPMELANVYGGRSSAHRSRRSRRCLRNSTPKSACTR